MSNTKLSNIIAPTGVATAEQGSKADSAVQPNDDVSVLNNDAGYIDASGAPVQSVNGETGAVSLDKGDIGLGNVPNLDTTDAVNKAHEQNTDNKLAEGTADEVSAAQISASLPPDPTGQDAGLSAVTDGDDGYELAPLADEIRRERFFRTVLQPDGIDTPPNVLFWPNPYSERFLDGNVNRPGKGWVFNEFSQLTEREADVLRRDYDPKTGAFLGALAEPERTNLLPSSDDFSSWDTDAVLVQPQPEARFGEVYSVVADETDGSHRIEESPGTLPTGVRYSVSVFVKPFGYKGFGVNIGAARCWAAYNLDAGEVNGSGSREAGGSEWADEKATIEAVGAGWFRCTLSALLVSGTQTRVRLILSEDSEATGDSSGFNPIFPGDGESGVLVAFAQFEAGAFSSSPIKTEGSPVVRPADNLTIPQVGDRRRGFICWEGVMRLDPNAQSSLQIRGFPFGRSTGNQAIVLRGSSPPLARNTMTTDAAILNEIPDSLFGGRPVRFAYFWDSDRNEFGFSVDGKSVTSTSEEVAVPPDDGISFGQTRNETEGASHTNWIYISYNIPPIEQIEAFTGAVVEGND